MQRKDNVSKQKKKKESKLFFVIALCLSALMLQGTQAKTNYHYKSQKRIVLKIYQKIYRKEILTKILFLIHYDSLKNK